MSLSNNALTTLARTKTYLEITGASQDAKLEQLIDAVSEQVMSFLDRDLRSQSYTEIFNGTGKNKKVLKNAPIVGTPTLSYRYADADFQSGWAPIDSDSIEVEASSGIVILDTIFARGERNYKAVYTAGYTLPQDAGYSAATNKLPRDIEMAVWELVGIKVNTSTSGGHSSEKVKNVTITFAKALSDNPHIKEMLERHRRLC